MIDILISYFWMWSELIVFPFYNFDLLWRLVPVYFYGVIIMAISRQSRKDAGFVGLAALWTGFDWIRSFYMGAGFMPTTANWVIAIIFVIYGIVSVADVFIKKDIIMDFFGRRSIFTYFAVSLYPIQTGFITYEHNTLIAVMIFALPIVLFLEVIPHLVGKVAMRANES